EDRRSTRRAKRVRNFPLGRTSKLMRGGVPRLAERSCMNRDNMRRLDEYRSHTGPLENDLIDVLADGGIDRQEFIKRATILGLSVGAIGSALAALDTPLAFGAPVRHTAGGRLRVGITPPPTKEIEPHTFADQGGLETGSINGEFLTRATQSL